MISVYYQLAPALVEQGAWRHLLASYTKYSTGEIEVIDSGSARRWELDWIKMIRVSKSISTLVSLSQGTIGPIPVYHLDQPQSIRQLITA
jgi:hypothetical protein